MKILITGSKGQLGTDLELVLSEHHQVFGFSKEDLDVTDFQKTKKVIAEIFPDLVIQAAAYTDVDGCELNPDQAYKVNAVGTQNVALACQEGDIDLLYVGTDYVFDGKKKEPYTEFDDPNPLSVYGRSKLAGERYVSTLLSKIYIIRTSWLYGKEGKNFVKTILKLAQGKDEFMVVNDQVGSPTYSYDLAQKIKEIVERREYGVYHVTNTGNCSWYQLAKDILEYAKIEGKKLKPITTEDFGRPAPRPSNSVLKNYTLQMRGFSLLRDYREALRSFLSEMTA